MSYEILDARPWHAYLYSKLDLGTFMHTFPLTPLRTINMRLLPIAAVLAAGMILAAAALQQQPSIPLGTVVYSVLDRGTFIQVNGTGWELLDGSETNIDDTDLCLVADFCSLPDARGVFIRGMNLGRAASTGDPDSARAVGSAQSDRFSSHHHRLQDELNEAGHTVHGNGQRARILVEDGQPYENMVWPTLTDDGGGGSETRPRNIALYTYIRVKR